ncbi:Helicase ARIP4like [Caligus rogercresseyi]|uniref:Helicase ARIP4like n=1 Tax=Caligus rogercresseyi TaxID=217165 RepID=A0A7T8JXR5_CALRO|nr:Helicase ARIP4like [Caligus rogercresseyi]
MALLKLNREKEAERDCTLAISLDPTYAKAYIRRAYARSGLKRYSDAITDYEKVLEIEPKNKMAKTEIEKLRLLDRSPSKKPLNPSPPLRKI